MGQKSRKKREERERRRREEAAPVNNGAAQPPQQAPSPAAIIDDDVWPVHPDQLIEKMANAMSNSLPCSKEERLLPDEMILVTESFRLSFPWQDFLSQIGAEVYFESEGVRRKFRLPKAHELFASAKKFRLALLNSGSPLLAEISAVAKQSTAQSRQDDVEAWVKRIRSMSVDDRFTMMRLIRLLINSASISHWASVEIFKEIERQVSPSLNAGQNTNSQEQIRALLKGQRSLTDNLRQGIEQEAPFWGLFFSRVYFFIAMRPRQPVVAFLPKMVAVIPPQDLQDQQEGDNFAGVLVPELQANQQEEREPENLAEEDEPRADQEGGEEEIPVLEGLRPLPRDDPRWQNFRTKEYIEHFGVLEVFEPVGSGFGSEVAAYPLITEPQALSIRFVVCDSPEKDRAAYAFYASLEEKRRAEEGIPPEQAIPDDDLTQWTQAATFARKLARRSELFIFRARHREVRGERISHILKIKKYMKTLKIRYKGE